MSVLDKKLEQLFELTNINDTDLIYVKRTGVSYKLQAGVLAPLRSATAIGTNTYVATLTPALTSLSPTLRLFVRFTNANTGAATLNMNSLGAKPIVKNVSTALATGDILAGQILCLAYDGTSFQVIGSNSSGGGGGGATNLDGLTDVVISTPATGQVLKFNGTAWVNDTDATGVGGGTIDNVPMDGSNNAVSSNGVFDALATKADVVSVLASTFAGGALSINLASAQVFRITLTGNVTSFNTSGGVPGLLYKVYFIQDATGNRTLAGLDAKLKTEDDRTILLSTTPGAVDLLQLDFEDASNIGLYPIYDRK